LKGKAAAGPADPRRIDAFKAEIAQIQRLNEHIDRANQLLSSTQSSRHSGSNVVCPRSTPAAKPAIKSPAEPVRES
jgi:hypothetical protein